MEQIVKPFLLLYFIGGIMIHDKASEFAGKTVKIRPDVYHP
jgi:hypothetical protein